MRAKRQSRSLTAFAKCATGFGMTAALFQAEPIHVIEAQFSTAPTLREEREGWGTPKSETAEANRLCRT